MVHSFEVEDAKLYGVECAVILYNLRFWLHKNLANGKHFHNERVWTYNSAKAFEELFPYMSHRQIYRRLQKLIDKGIVVTGDYGNPWDQSKWYSVNESPFTEIGKWNCQNRQMELPKTVNRNTENGKSYTDSKPDSKPDQKPYIAPTKNDVIEFFKESKKIEDDDIQLEAENFINHWEEQEWTKRDGRKVKYWRRQAATWQNNYLKFNRASGKKGASAPMTYDEVLDRMSRENLPMSKFEMTDKTDGKGRKLWVRSK